MRVVAAAFSGVMIVMLMAMLAVMVLAVMVLAVVVTVAVIISCMVAGRDRAAGCGTNSRAEDGAFTATHFRAQRAAHGTTHRAANGRIRGEIAREGKGAHQREEGKRQQTECFHKRLQRRNQRTLKSR